MPNTFEQELEHWERQLHQPEVRTDPEAVAALLADDFREFGSSGRIWHKDEIVQAIQNEQPRTPILMQSFRAQRLSRDTMLVTYVASSNVETLRSSIWVRRDGRWQMLFHQGTRLASMKAAY